MTIIPVDTTLGIWFVILKYFSIAHVIQSRWAMDERQLVTYGPHLITNRNIMSYYQPTNLAQIIGFYFQVYVSYNVYLTVHNYTDRKTILDPENLSLQSNIYVIVDAVGKLCIFCLVTKTIHLLFSVNWIVRLIFKVDYAFSKLCSAVRKLWLVLLTLPTELRKESSTRSEEAYAQLWRNIATENNAIKNHSLMSLSNLQFTDGSEMQQDFLYKGLLTLRGDTTLLHIAAENGMILPILSLLEPWFQGNLLTMPQETLQGGEE